MRFLRGFSGYLLTNPSESASFRGIAPLVIGLSRQKSGFHMGLTGPAQEEHAHDVEI